MLTKLFLMLVLLCNSSCHLVYPFSPAARQQPDDGAVDQAVWTDRGADLQTPRDSAPDRQWIHDAPNDAHQQLDQPLTEAAPDLLWNVDAPLPLDAMPPPDSASKPDSSCPLGETRCGTDCVKLGWNNKHCTKCFDACSTGTVCCNSTCHGPPYPC